MMFPFLWLEHLLKHSAAVPDIALSALLEIAVPVPLFVSGQYIVAVVSAGYTFEVLLCRYCLMGFCCSLLTV